MNDLLALDAGGTSTRAVIVSPEGRCLGYGTSEGGNPASRGFEAAVGSVAEAILRARAMVSEDRGRWAGATLAMAGASLHIAGERFAERLRPLGLAGPLMIESDLLAVFHSGTFHDRGYTLVSGTGAIAARIRGGIVDAVADGTGWLLGDVGSGFWIGHQVMRAVAAALDGRGAPTALTQLVLAELQIAPVASGRLLGRVPAQQQLLAKVYGLHPVELSRFAPLVFAAGDDPAAQDIVHRAADGLAASLGAVLLPGFDGPLVFGGSILTKTEVVADAVLAALASSTRGSGTLPVDEAKALPAPPGVAAPIRVADGVVGAAVLALKGAGIAVDQDVFARLTGSLATLR